MRGISYSAIKDINDRKPLFLDIGNHHPVSLFGGDYHSAAIGSDCEFIFINRKSMIDSPNSPIEAVFLPDGEKALSVACCNDSVVVLSSNGRVLYSKNKPNEVLKFSIVSELSDQEIACVSGTCSHFLAVNKDGRVVGLGSNEYGQLGFKKEQNQFRHSQRFHHCKNMKSEQHTLYMNVHFSTYMENSSSAVDKVKMMLIYQEKQPSLAVPHSAP